MGIERDKAAAVGNLWSTGGRKWRREEADKGNGESERNEVKEWQ